MARSGEHDDQQQQQRQQEQQRLQELRQKPEAQRSTEEKAELERLEKNQGTSGQRPQNQGTSGERPPGSRPLDHPTPGALTAEEQGRLRELNAKRTALTDEETAELDELRVRNTPQSAAQTDRVQRELSPDRPPAPMTDFPRDQANRLRDLRVAADMGRLSEEEKSEMGKLGMEESKAAGHAEPVEGRAGPDDEDDRVIYDVLGLVEMIIARTPAFRDLEIIARMLRDRLDTLRDSPEAGPQPRRPSSVTETRPSA